VGLPGEDKGLCQAVAIVTLHVAVCGKLGDSCLTLDSIVLRWLSNPWWVSLRALRLQLGRRSACSSIFFSYLLRPIISPQRGGVSRPVL
jgi:hypothetical protein